MEKLSIIQAPQHILRVIHDTNYNNILYYSNKHNLHNIFCWGKYRQYNYLKTYIIQTERGFPFGNPRLTLIRRWMQTWCTNSIVFEGGIYSYIRTWVPDFKNYLVFFLSSWVLLLYILLFVAVHVSYLLLHVIRPLAFVLSPAVALIISDSFTYVFCLMTDV